MTGGFLAVSVSAPADLSRLQPIVDSAKPFALAWQSIMWQHPRSPAIVRLWEREKPSVSSVVSTPDALDASWGLGSTSQLVLVDDELQARADVCGFGTIFVWQSAGIAAVSTRIELLAQLAISWVGTAALTLDSAVADLAYIGFLDPTTTGYREIRAVDPDNLVALKDGTATVSPHPDAIRWNRSFHSPSLGDLVDAGAAGIRRNIAEVLDLDLATYVDLTAGFDTRLNLAGLVALDAAGSASFQTVGADTLDDVARARHIADSLGLEHRWGFPYEGPHDGFADRLRAHARCTAGTGNPKDGIREPLDPIDHIRVSGLYGELLRGWRTHASRTAGIAGVTEQVGRAFGANRLSLLQPDAAADARRRVDSELVDHQDPDRPAWHAAHRFYARTRLRSRASRSDDLRPGPQVYPLYSPDLVDIGLDAMWHHPDADIGQLIIDRLAPDLQGVVDRYTPARAPDGATHKKPDSLMRVALAQQTDERAAAFASLAEVDGQAWDVVDRVAYQHAVDDYATLTHPQLSLLHGAATAIEWLNG